MLASPDVNDLYTFIVNTIRLNPVDDLPTSREIGRILCPIKTDAQVKRMLRFIKYVAMQSRYYFNVSVFVDEGITNLIIDLTTEKESQDLTHLNDDFTSLENLPT